MSVVIADTFTKSLERLEVDERNAVKLTTFDYQTDPRHPSLNWHKLDKVKDKGFRSLYVNMDLRIIVYDRDDVHALMYTGHHDDAYRWVANRQMAVNPGSGAIQLVQVQERVQEIVREVFVDRVVKHPLFDTHSDEYLLAIGVPEAWLEPIKRVDEDGFLKILDELPPEAAERLSLIAQGESVPKPVRITGNPFEHPEARMHFRVVDGDRALLERALNEPRDRWAIFLHPSQHSAAYRSYAGPAKVTGGAGTGKTVTALHRAADLALKNPQARILVTTFGRTLAAQLDRHLDLLLEPGSRERASIRTSHLHRLAHELWEERTGRRFRPPSDRDLDDRLKRLGRQHAPDFSPAFLRAEFDAVVDREGIRTYGEYKDVPRAGRGIAIGIRQRKALWNVFEALLDELEQGGLTTFDRMVHELRATLDATDERPFDHVIADEVQDFGVPELQLLRALAAPGPNDLFLAGDVGQRIYKAGASYRQCGIEIVGRSTILRVNYRTTEQIRRLADSLLPGTLRGDDDEDEHRANVSLFRGPVPSIVSFSHPDAEIAHVSSRIDHWTRNGFDPEDIAIFARTNNVLRDRAEAALKMSGIPAHALTDDAPPREGHVSVGTMHRAKGLEFRIVVVMGCDEDQLPMAHFERQIDDPVAKRQFVERERNLLYVASTRAREELVLTYSGRPSRFLSDLPPTGRRRTDREPGSEADVETPDAEPTSAATPRTN